LIQLAGNESRNYEIAQQIGGGDYNKVPGLAGNLDLNHPYDVLVAVPASHYMEHMSDGSVMNRVYDEEDDGTVLGANVIMGHDVLFDAQDMELGWAESDCDYAKIVEDNGFPSALQGGVVETLDEIEEEDEEAEDQEEEKELYDEENTEEEIEEDNENIEEVFEEGGEIANDLVDDDQHFTKSHHNHTVEIPLDSLFDNPEYAGAGMAIAFLVGSVCLYKCCCAKSVQKKKKRRYRNKQREIEMKINGTRTYKDDFGSGNGYSDGNGDDESSDDSESEDEFDDEAGEYGESSKAL